AGGAATANLPPPSFRGHPPAGAATAAARDTPTRPPPSHEGPGHPVLTLGFDTSSMPLEDMQKAPDEAKKWVDEKMTPAALCAVAAINSSLQVLTDFTSSKERVRSVLARFSATDGTAFEAVDSNTAATAEANQTATSDATTVDQSAQELDTFNNDVRL